MDALRLAGRLKDRRGPVSLERVRAICAFSYEGFSAEELIAELEAVDYIRPSQVHDREWVRNFGVPYPRSASSYLKRIVQKLKHVHRSDQLVSVVREDVDDGVAHWFGYCKHPVYLTGRVHQLGDEE